MGNKSWSNLQFKNLFIKAKIDYFSLQVVIINISLIIEEAPLTSYMLIHHGSKLPIQINTLEKPK